MSIRFYFDIQIEYFGVFFGIDASSWWLNKFAYQLINNSFAHLSQEIKFNIWYDRTIFRHCYYLIYRWSISPFRKRNSQTKKLICVINDCSGSLKQLQWQFFADDLESEEKKSTNSCYISEQRLCKETVVFELSHSKTFRIRMYHSFFCRIVSVCKHIFLRRKFYVLFFVTHRHTHSHEQ